MLRVPKLRQPDLVTCFPTAVWAVLLYHGYEVEFGEVASACRLGRYGVLQEIAVQGLREAEYDVQVAEVVDAETIRSALDGDCPLIITVETGVTEEGGFGHAVVVCDLEGDVLTVMDPLRGEYEHLSLGEALPQLGRGLSGALLISGRPARGSK